MSMNKTLRIVFKVLGIGIAALAVIVIALIIIAVICVPPAPSASNSQLEKACGIAFPSYTIIDKDEQSGSHTNYYYTVRFDEPLDEEIIERIEYLCEYGQVLDDGLEQGGSRPWKKRDGEYFFNLDSWFDRGQYELPRGCRCIDLDLSRDLSTMTIHFMMDE